MTYDGLILAVEEIADSLRPHAYRLLHHLIATAISEGTNEIQVSSGALAKRLQCSRDKVREAAAALKPYVEVSANHATGHTFRLPAVWFTQGKGIFTDWETVEKSPGLASNQATSWRETRQPVGVKPGNPGGIDGENQATGWRETRQPSRTNGEDQATGWRETRQPLEQNQQVTGGEKCRSIDLDSLVQLQSFRSIEEIALCKTLSPEQRADAIELSAALRSHQCEFGKPRGDLGHVDEQILARCLAVAPLRELHRELKKLREHHTPAGSSYAWYPTVFCQRLKGIKSEIWAAALRHVAKQARRRPQANLDFSTRLTDEVRMGMRRIS
jgi:hypothetical protein